MESSHFFAMLSRMKYICRWGLMRNTRSETLSEHCFETAVLAHALAVLRNRRFGGNVSPERTALLALFHDVPEVITGDLPTPVKYFSPAIRGEYGRVEEAARERLLSALPQDLQEEYASLLAENGSEEESASLVKAADKLSALIKCVEERRAGNQDFRQAERATLCSLQAMGLPEVDVFLREFLPSYSLTVDEQEVGREKDTEETRNFS